MNNTACYILYISNIIQQFFVICVTLDGYEEVPIVLIAVKIGSFCTKIGHPKHIQNRYADKYRQENRHCTNSHSLTSDIQGFACHLTVNTQNGGVNAILLHPHNNRFISVVYCF